MRSIDIIKRAGRSLRQAKIRTLLTSLAISVGAFTITVAFAAGAGSQNYANDLIENNGDKKVLYVLSEKEKDSPEEYNKNEDTVGGNLLSNKDIKKINNIDGVASIVSSYNISARYMTRGGDAKKYETSLAVKSDKTALALIAGSLEDNQVRKGEVVIPEFYLGVLGFNDAESAVGERLTIRIERLLKNGRLEAKNITYNIVAVDKKSSVAMRYTPSLRVSIEDGASIYNYQTKYIPDSDRYYMASVRVKDDADTEAVKEAIANIGYEVKSMKDMQEIIFQFIDILKWGAAGFGILAVIASIFGIINTQYISVLERTQQIGLMKALGSKRKDIGKLFRYEAAWVGLLGGFLGTALALATKLLNPVISEGLGLEEGTELLAFDPITSSVLILSLTLIAVLAGYLPARKASRLDPIEALRTE